MVKESGEEPVSRLLYFSVVFFFQAQVTPATAALGSPLRLWNQLDYSTNSQ